MKNSMMLFFVFLNLISIQGNVLSQNNELLIIGKEYKIILFSEKEIVGILISETENDIILKTKSSTLRIEKNNIFSISKDTTPSRNKFIATLSSGLVPSNNTSSNFLLNGNFSYFYSEDKTIGGDLTVNFYKENYYTYFNSSYNYGKQMYIDLLVNAKSGNFDKDNIIDIYFNIGAGVHFEYINSYTSSYFNYSDSTLYTFETPSSFKPYVLVQLGGGLTIKPAKNIGINLEADLNMYLFSYVVIPSQAYIPLKLGISYYFFK